MLRVHAWRCLQMFVFPGARWCTHSTGFWVLQFTAGCCSEGSGELCCAVTEQLMGGDWWGTRGSGDFLCCPCCLGWNPVSSIRLQLREETVSAALQWFCCHAQRCVTPAPVQYSHVKKRKVWHVSYKVVMIVKHDLHAFKRSSHPKARHSDLQKWLQSIFLKRSGILIHWTTIHISSVSWSILNTSEHLDINVPLGKVKKAAACAQYSFK